MIDIQLQSKYTQLRGILRDLGSVAIGFSGGIDSTLLIRVATDVLGSKALAIIGRSETIQRGNSKRRSRWPLRLDHATES